MFCTNLNIMCMFLKMDRVDYNKIKDKPAGQVFHICILFNF